MSNILIKNILILPMNATEDQPKYFEGSIGVRGSKILFVGDDTAQVEAFEMECGSDITIIDGAGKLAMPGLINLHNHVPMTLMRSYADDQRLNEWLNNHIWPFEAQLTRNDIFEGARFGIAEMLLGGTTSFLDMYWHNDAIADAILEMGIRGGVGCSVLDRNVDSFESEVELMNSKYRGVSDRLSYRLAPHAPYSCSPETTKRVVELSDKHGLAIHTHMNETKWEIETIKEIYNSDPVSYFDSFGVFDRSVVAAHGIWLSDSDMELFARKGVSVAHNPQSNMKMAAGVAPIVKMREAGVNVAIGTDGPCSNNDLDMWDEMRTASFLQKVSVSDPCAMSAYETLEMATVCGAKALGRDNLGMLAEGFLADITILDINKAHYFPRNDMVANLVYCGKASDVDTVIVDGEILVRGGALTHGHIMDYALRAETISREIKARLEC